MGAYLSEPIVKKETEEDENAYLRVASASMQGWRMTQEDAHNAILEFDKNSSLFAVYDGHGGHEVAAYSAIELPPFIKKNTKYIEGKVKEALVESFIEFDRTITNRDVVIALRKIAGTYQSKEEEEAEHDPKEVDTLYEEATMPIEDILTKYGEDMPKPKLPAVAAIAGSSKTKPISPFLRAKSTSAVGDCPEEDAKQTLDFKANEVEANGDKANSDAKEEIKEEDVKEEDVKEDTKEDVKEPVVNGNSANGHHEENDNVNGDAPAKGKGKGKGKGKSSAKKDSSEEEVEEEEEKIPEKKKMSAAELYKSLLSDSVEEEDMDSDDEDDEMFDHGDSNSDDDDDEEEEEEEENDDSLEEEDTEDTEDEEVDGEEYIGGDYNEEPGNDSGCTAVVALLRGNELFVANAGDSRCIVCRDGKAIEMSFDHKPEDDPELKRIEAAGGRVTPDGRVNGGLNLSRAIGDHAYKTKKTLPLTEQMISPVPDIRTLKLDSKKDSFILLACDGIWNSMSSQEVAEFVQEKLAKFDTNDPSTKQLTTICSELFEHCLAPDTVGDGTGCDNMTAVLVKLRPAFENKPTSVPEVQTEAANTNSVAGPSGEKRSADDVCEEGASASKKLKTAEEEVKSSS